MRKQTAGVPGMRVFFQNPPAIRLGGRLTKSQYQLTLQSTDTKDLYEFAPEARGGDPEAATDPRRHDRSFAQEPAGQSDIDRDKAASLGITAEQIDDALYSAYGFRQVSTIYASNASYQVILGVSNKDQSAPSVLPLLYVRGTGGRSCPSTRW